jgi:hypothetical protein
MITDIITDTKQWVCLRWDLFEGHYYVGPFANFHEAAEWGSDNEGTDACWQVERLDPNVALEIRAPGDMPQLKPEYPDGWIERQGDVGDFYLLMTQSDPLHLVGPFPDHRHAFSWGDANEARTDDQGWQVIWLDDPTAPAPLLSLADGVVEAVRSEEAWRREQEQRPPLGWHPLIIRGNQAQPKSGLSWPERIENYRRLIGTPHLHYEDGWCTGTWVLGNSYGKKTDYYGAYQGNFLKRIAALFPDRRRVLHLFAGKVDTAAFPGDTLDIRHGLAPTYCCNAETCVGVPLADYDFVLADPPYSESDAEHYGMAMVNRNHVVRTLSDGLRPGAYVVWLDQVYPMYARVMLEPEALIGIVGSTNHRFRVLTAFRKV